MAVRKAVKIDPSAIEGATTMAGSPNDDFQATPANADSYQDDPGVIGATNKLQQTAWKMKSTLHQQDFEKEWSKMSPKEQEKYMADIKKQYDQKMAKRRTVNPSTPEAPLDTQVADGDDTQGL